MWDEIRNIFTKGEELTGKESLYMIARVLSYSPFSFIQVKAINQYIGKVPDIYLLKIIQNTVPKMEPPWIDYPKSKKGKKVDGDMEKLIQEICNYFHCSEHYAKQINRILLKEGKNPMAMFGVNVF